MLVYLGIALVASFVVEIVNALHPLAPAGLTAVWILVALAIERVAGHAPRGVALRPVIGYVDGEAAPDGAQGLDHWKRWYIESRPAGGAPPHSCSFVEFDERGDYLDFAQHRHAYQKIMQFAHDERPLTIVIYVHGWRHSGQSYDVIAFNEFLHQLAGGDTDGRGRRVHGVYLAWRGASLKHVIQRNETFADVTGYFGGEIVDSRVRARLPLLNVALESLSYFDRKSVPEHKFSGTALSRTMFSCAYAAKRSHGDRQVLLIGHSFGGLTLERTFQNAAISQLTQAWPWGEPETAGRRVNPLPFDTVLIVNSAAPSIYAKQFQSYLAAHRQAMARAHVPHANSPFVFSVTSSADWATGIAHPVANMFCFLLPTLWRKYHGNDFVLVPVAPPHPDLDVPQAYYYRHTPGHNPLLVNRFIEAVKTNHTAGPARSQVHQNLGRPSINLDEFKAATGPQQSPEAWKINFPPQTPVFDAFSRYRGRRPVVWTEGAHSRYLYNETAYWIIRCPKEIISGHNDIWSQPAMDTYAALHRIAIDGNTH